MNNIFIIALDGLKGPKTELDARIGKEFFEEFENDQILDADVKVLATVEKSGKYIGIDLKLEGSVTVPCDRCLEPLTLPVNACPRFSVKFSPVPSVESPEEENGREILVLPENEAVLDLGQIVYDFVCLSIPIVKAHPEGECDPDTVKYLSRGTLSEASGAFSSLRELLKKK